MTLTDTRQPIAISDRCDKCGARAMVRAAFPSGELHFCGHHAREAGTKLVLQATEVYDPEGAFNIG